MPETLFNIRLDDEDRALLDAVAAEEKLTRSDIIRRAIRAYAKAITVQPPERQAQRKPKRKK